MDCMVQHIAYTSQYLTACMETKELLLLQTSQKNKQLINEVYDLFDYITEMVQRKFRESTQRQIPHPTVQNNCRAVAVRSIFPRH